MDDDDFGGFEAAESYEFGNGEKQTTSPAIAWAAFPTVPEVHRSPDILLEYSVPSSCLVPSDSFILSSDNVATSIQTGKSMINPAVPEEQIQADIPVASSNVIEDKTLADVEMKRTNEPKSCLQQAVANLKIKLCSAEEEKLKIKQELEYLLEKHSVLEMDFLKEKKEEVLPHQDHYKTLQEKHKQELEDMRKAGHEALTIIVEEFKALLESTVQQQEAAIEKQYILTIEKHSRKCEDLLDAQESRKTTGPLYLYLNLHQTIFIWNHCLENFMQGRKHYNLFLNAFFFKLIFTKFFLTLSCYFPEGRVEILVFLSTVDYHFLEKFEAFFYFIFFFNLFPMFYWPSCHETICSSEFLQRKILQS
ncbi:coiled-coil domain-containing protein 91 isoform X5 [Cyanistes caeruleus]|uniref:Coiled-coil domain containing 91 n=1 Tax=Cyanistes caeruleus TaxID=156563 RepID=A0A8C0VG32_CYACU|nr:coiled-coil domain-containing protein 91 isoform X5 [Cyanistes caeruleus]